MFHQVHLVDTKGWDLTAWGSLYIVYALVSSLCKLLVDRFGAMRLVPFNSLPFGFGLAERLTLCWQVASGCALMGARLRSSAARV